MTRSWRPFYFGCVLLGLSAAALQGCDQLTGSDQVAASSCGAGSAAIGVADGLVAILCGCDEAGGAWQTFDAGLTCSVRSGTTVIFHYLGTRLRHQIAPTASSAAIFAPSPVSDPGEDPWVRAHGVTLQAGIYTFTDLFDSRLASTLVVGP